MKHLVLPFLALASCLASPQDVDPRAVAPIPAPLKRQPAYPEAYPYAPQPIPVGQPQFVNPGVRYTQQPFQYAQQPVVRYPQPQFPYAQQTGSLGYVRPGPQFIQPAQQYIEPQYVAQPSPKYIQPQVPAGRMNPNVIAILRSAADINFDGSFFYDYETENGISARAEGTVKSLGPEESANVMSGSYSYTAPDGTPITTHWVADEFGFRAVGDHIPKVPEAIARSLEYINSLPPSREGTAYQNQA